MGAAKSKPRTAPPLRSLIIGVAVACLLVVSPGTATAAVTASELTSGGATTNTNSYTTASITPTANNLILAWISNSKNTAPDTPTLTYNGTGLTFVQVTTVTWGTIASPTKRTTLFRAMGASPTAGTVTITFGPSQTGCLWNVVQFGNVDTSGTNGSGAVVQSATNAVDSSSTLNVPLAALADSANATAGGFSNNTNNVAAILPGAGYTAFTGAAYNNPASSGRAEWRPDGSTTVNVSATFIGAIGGVAVEIQHLRTLALANHTLGQIGDQFTTTTPVTAVLFRFNLTRNAATVTVDNLRVNFTTTGGVANGDVTNGALYLDVNNDGAVDGGDTLIQSGVTPVGGVLTFTTNFSPGASGTNYLVQATVANLVATDTTTFSVGTADIDEVETGVVESGSISNATHTQDTPTLTLADHSTQGQIGDQFTTTTPVTAVLFRFDLRRTGTVTIQQLRVNFTTTGGVANADVTNGELYVDVNHDGAVDGGDTLIQGGITPVGGVLTFWTSFSPGTGYTDYLVRATVANLVPGDTTTFSVGTADIDELESPVIESGSISNATHTQDTPTLTLANHTLGQIADQFTTTTPVTAVLFRLNLTRALTVTVDNVRVNFTTTGGVVNADVTSGELYQDVNNDGAVDGGDTLIQGGVTPVGGVLTFTTNFTPGTSGTNYLVRATVANLVPGDTTTFSVGTADIDVVEGGVSKVGSIANATHTEDSLAATLLTFNNKYVVSSATAAATTSTTLVDDSQASQTFNLSAPQTVLVIYQANSVEGATMAATGMQNAINVDGTNRANSWDSAYSIGGNHATRNTVFWIGTLGSGSHTIKGSFAVVSSGTATINNRVLLIYIFDGDAFQYVDSTTTSTSNSSSLGDDPAASFTFTPASSCKALILYNIANSGATEDGWGKMAAINIGGTDYSQAEKSADTSDYPDSVFTVWATQLAASATTVKGRFARNNTTAGTVTIHRRQFGVLLFHDTTLLDNNVTSDTAVTTSSSTLVDDGQATITRTTTDTRELLVVGMGTKRSNFSLSSVYGFGYGVMVDTNDRAHSRGSPFGGIQAISAGVAWAEQLAPGSHTIKGRFSNNTGTETVMVDSRRIVALWFPLGLFQYRRMITLNYSQRGSGCTTIPTGLPDFPVQVSYTDVTLKTAPNGNVQNANGYDIIFRASDGVTQLDHEMEKYDGSTGEVIAWVRVPALFAGDTSTTIYMYYDNAMITSPTANPTGVWDANYKAVWHLKDATGTTVGDSTTTPDNGAPNGSPVQQPGQIDGSLTFDPASNQYVNVTNSTDLQLATNMTISAWVKTLIPANDTQYRLITAKWKSSQTPPAQNYWLGKFCIAGPSSDLRFIVDGSQYVSTPYAPISDYVFHHVAAVADATNHLLRIFVDGLQMNTAAYSGTSQTGNSDLQIALSPDGPLQLWSGGIDEVRISNIARDACWISTEYNCQSSNGTFITMGAEALAGPTAVEMVSLDAEAHAGRGVLVSWRTGFEVDNLGFHVYREAGGERVRLTPSLVAGSALVAGAGTPLTAGRSYTWWDRSPVAGASYWVEEWELGGEKRWHGPASVQPGPAGVQAQSLTATASDGSVQASSRLLAGLGQSASSASSTSQPHVVRRRLQPGAGTDGDRLAVQWSLASRAAVKILVSEDGWFRVSQEELAAAGLDPAVDPDSLQLYTEGQQVQILVDAKTRGRFAPGDGIEFLGEGPEGAPVAVRVYWLVAGSEAGLRIPEAAGGGGWAEGPASFPAEVERADRTLYFPAILNGDASNFFGAVVTSTPVVQTIRVPHVEAGSPGELVVRLMGATVGTHRVVVELNNVRMGTMVWAEMTENELVIPVGPGMIVEGENRVVLTAEGGEWDASAVDSIRIRYAHTWEADGDRLEFSLGGYQQVRIAGFAGPGVRVLDISEPGAIQRLPAEVSGDGQGTTVTVGVPEAGERTVLAVGTGAIRHPVGVVPNRPTSWNAVTEGADLVIMAHRSLLPAVEPLRALRESQGLKVAVVDVDNVFDEFSYGVKEPRAIRDFMAYAKSRWVRPPRYLLLVGDASYDPRNYLGFGWADLVPTKLVDTMYMETASDDWMTDFDGDGIADVPVGRIPVQLASEATTAIRKIVAYDSGAKFNRVLLVADANDEENDFEALSAQVKAAVPSKVWVSEILRGQVWDAAAGQLASQLNLGQTLVNYVGHGSVTLWHGNVLTTDEALALRNYWYPFVVSMTCLNGYFQDPQFESLAEGLLEGPGGAVAVWASSGLTESASQVPIDEALVRLLFSGTTTLGDATKAAKAATPDMDVRRSWILFGDPSTKLR